MPGTQERLKKATDLLKEDHEKVKDLFNTYEELGPTATVGKSDLFERIRRELLVHAELEEQAFYPAIAEIDDLEAESLVAEAREEHKLVKELLEQLAQSTPGDATFDARMKVLFENVEHHADEEEKEMFPLVRKLPREKQDRLARDIVDLKNAKMRGIDEDDEFSA